MKEVKKSNPSHSKGKSPEEGKKRVQTAEGWKRMVMREHLSAKGTSKNK